MRWLLLDEIAEIQKGRRARSLSRIPSGEVSPEILLIEMMAQTGGVLLGAENEFKDNVVFAKIEACEFPERGEPGEAVEIVAVSNELKPEGSWIEGVVQNPRGIYAKARLMLVSAGKLVPEQIHSITFHKAFMEHFKVKEKVR